MIIVMLKRMIVIPITTCSVILLQMRVKLVIKKTITCALNVIITSHKMAMQRNEKIEE